VYRLPWVSVLRCVVASLPPSMATAAAHNKVTVERECVGRVPGAASRVGSIGRASAGV